MPIRKTAHISLFLLLVSLLACGKQTATSDSGNPSESPSPIVSSSPSSDTSTEQPTATATQRPEVSSTTIQVEGTTVDLSLNRVEDPQLPFTTYVPASDFVTDIITGSKTPSVAFYSNLGGQVNEAAQVRIVMMERSKKLADLQEAILGKEGLLAQQKWQIADRTEVVTYPWAVEQIRFRSTIANQSTVGQIFLGEHEGQPFYVVIRYPIEYAEGFEPRAMVILDELMFRK